MCLEFFEENLIANQFLMNFGGEGEIPFSESTANAVWLKISKLLSLYHDLSTRLLQLLLQYIYIYIYLCKKYEIENNHASIQILMPSTASFTSSWPIEIQIKHIEMHFSSSRQILTLVMVIFSKIVLSVSSVFETSV